MLWAAASPVSGAANPSITAAGVKLSATSRGLLSTSQGLIGTGASTIPYDEQMLLSAAGCQFGLYATGSSGAIMQSHAAIAASTYTALSATVQLPLADAVMQTIGCACESIDGFDDTFKLTLDQGEPFPTQFFLNNPNHQPYAGVPKSDYGQTHTYGTLRGLYGDIYSRFTAMQCLNASAGAGAACQHRTTVACKNSTYMLNYLAAHPDPDPADFLRQPGGCYQLAMEWHTPSGEAVWTNVMPHEIWKTLVAKDTAGVGAINATLIESLTPSYRVQGIATDNPLLTHLVPCEPQRTFLARTQAIANLQAFQATYAASPPVSAPGPSEGLTWQLLQLAPATDLLATLSVRACQYLNATASELQLCPISSSEQQDLQAASPRPSGRLCYMNSSVQESHILHGAVDKANALVAGLASETGIASAMSDLQTSALIQFPATSVTTLLLAISGAAVSLVTCEKEKIRVGIQRHTKRALKLATMCVCARFVSQEHMRIVVSLTVYALVSLTIAGPGIAIIITNIQYSRAFLTATVVATSGPIADAPGLEITLTETVKLLYKPKNFAASLVLGCALVAVSLLWGISRGLRAARQPVTEHKGAASSSLREYRVQLSDAQLERLSLAQTERGQATLKVSSA